MGVNTGAAGGTISAMTGSGGAGASIIPDEFSGSKVVMHKSFIANSNQMAMPKFEMSHRNSHNMNSNINISNINMISSNNSNKSNSNIGSASPHTESVMKVVRRLENRRGSTRDNNHGPKDSMGRHNTGSTLSYLSPGQGYFGRELDGLANVAYIPATGRPPLGKNSNFNKRKRESGSSTDETSSPDSVDSSEKKLSTLQLHNSFYSNPSIARDRFPASILSSAKKSKIIQDRDIVTSPYFLSLSHSESSPRADADSSTSKIANYKNLNSIIIPSSAFFPAIADPLDNHDYSAVPTRDTFKSLHGISNSINFNFFANEKNSNFVPTANGTPGSKRSVKKKVLDHIYATKLKSGELSKENHNNCIIGLPIERRDSISSSDESTSTKTSNAECSSSSGEDSNNYCPINARSATTITEDLRVSQGGAAGMKLLGIAAGDSMRFLLGGIAGGSLAVTPTK